LRSARSLRLIVTWRLSAQSFGTTEFILSDVKVRQIPQDRQDLRSADGLSASA
jgi:hypothetical protein